MTKAISVATGGEDVVSSEYIYHAKDSPEDVEESIEENVIELKDDLLENSDCVRVWSK